MKNEEDMDRFGCLVKRVRLENFGKCLYVFFWLKLLYLMLYCCYLKKRDEILKVYVYVNNIGKIICLVFFILNVDGVYVINKKFLVLFIIW